MVLCAANQLVARTLETTIPQSDLDSELTHAQTCNSVDRDSWTEDAGFHSLVLKVMWVSVS